MPPLSIHRRLFLSFLATLILAVFSTWAVATSLFGSTLEARLRRQVTHVADTLAEVAFPLTTETLARMAGLLRLDLVLIGPSGGISLSTTDAATARTLVRDRYRAWVARGRPDAAETLDLQGRPLLLLLRPVEGRRDARFIAVAALADLADVRRAAWHSALSLAALGLLGALLLAWVGNRISRGITRPVGELAALADALAEGRRGLRSGIRRGDEIGRLAASLNHLSERLTSYEDRLEQETRLAALGEMAARVAHEIRNPLTAIKLQLQLLAEEGGQDRETLEALLDEVRRLEWIVAATLGIGRKRPPQPRPTDLNALLGEAGRLMGPQLSHLGIQLETRLAEPLPEVSVDPDRIKQILFNLLLNAAQALPRGGRIRLASEALDAPRRVRLRVEDSGPGLPPALREAPFSGQVAAPRGLGIGLHLCAGLAREQGGTLVTCTPAPELGGACFELTFPWGEGP